MRDAYDLEERCLRAVQELRVAATVQLEYERISPSAATPEEMDIARRDLDEDGKLHVESALRHQFFVSRENPCHVAEQGSPDAGWGVPDPRHAGLGESSGVRRGRYHLFADVDFQEWMQETAGELQVMVDTFPALFPQYDYEPLRALGGPPVSDSNGRGGSSL